MKKTPIAIIGIGCRFPGAQGPNAFWNLLRDGIDAITPAPLNRFENINPDSSHSADAGNNRLKEGGFLEQVDQFEPTFFGISPREALYMDPQQRLLLETSWEALEDAGQVPAQLAGTRTGVFIGISLNDYSHILWGGATTKKDEASEALFLQTGTSHAIAANRLSYFFDFHGPSVAFNTACSSSLVAIHQACQSLWIEESTLALAGGINLLLFPKVTERLVKAGFLSPDGRCRSFDAQGKGYVRGEGVGMVVLKPVSQAIADGDSIYAVIRGSVMNQDGRSNGITAPNRHAQEALLEEAYRQAGVPPDDIHYIEANGTGTVLGDSLEARALGTVLNQKRTRRNPCILGSVKTNIGHLEAASGIAGLIKVALSLQEKQIPPNLHFNVPNPYIDFDALGLRVPKTLEMWPEGHGPRLAGINSFGFGGTNVHMVMEEFLPGPAQSKKEGKKEVRPYHLFTLRAKDKHALRELMSKFGEFLASNTTGEIGDICFTANVRRAEFPHRVAIVTKSVAQLREQLDGALAGRNSSEVCWGEAARGEPVKVTFLFSNEGSQYTNMGRQLYETFPVFRDAFAHCARILSSENDQPLLSMMYPQSPEPHLFQDLTKSHLALFALEYSLAQLWKSFGVEPQIVMGYGVGEYVAACMAGVFSTDDAQKLILNRSLLVKARLQEESESLSSNKSENIVTEISHDEERQSRIFSKQKHCLQHFKNVLANVNLKPPRINGVCFLTGNTISEEWTNPMHWIRHAQDPVQDLQGNKGDQEKETNLVIEIGPRQMESELVQNSPSHSTPRLRCQSLHSEQKNRYQILQSLGALFVRGVKVDWNGLDQGYTPKFCRLPTYPFQRQRYWLETNRSDEDVAKFQSNPSNDSGKSGEKIPISQSSETSEKRNILEGFSGQSSEKNPEENTFANELSAIFREIWESVLEIKPIGLHDNFFDVGGNSLLATQVIARLRNILEIDIPLRTIFDCPTIASFAVEIDTYLTKVLPDETRKVTK